jgi:hypothetical protein
MTIIQFPGGGDRGRDDETAVERASRLKRRLVDFVVRGPMRDEHARAMADAGLDEPEFHEFVDFTDWFIFEWEGDDGECVLDEFLASEPELADEDRQLVDAWYDAVDDVFQVVEVADDGVTLRDGEGATYLAIPTNMKPGELGWRPRTLVHTRLVPVDDIYLMSGIQSFYGGPDAEELPADIDITAFKDMLDGGELDALDPDDDEDDEDAIVIDDVRDVPEHELVEGTVAAAARRFLDETAASLKPETADAHALTVSFLAYRAAERGVELASAVDAGLLLDFLAVWYPRVAPERTLGLTRQVIGATGKFAAWLGRVYGTSVGRDFKRDVLPAVKDDLPRTVKAMDEMLRWGPMFGISQLLGALAERVEGDGRPGARNDVDSFQGRFAVVAVDEDRVTLRPSATESGAVVALHTIDLPRRTADLLRPGDVVEGVFQTVDGRLIAEGIECIYGPAAGL